MYYNSRTRKIIRMLYFRYRPISELSLKELRYNEIYFSSTEENNDPYDGKVFLSYEFDINKWERFFNTALARTNIPKELLKRFSKELAKKISECNIKTYNDISTYDFVNAILSTNKKIGSIFAYHLSEVIKQFIDIYRPTDKYIVSFSKVNDNMLMWSHYASKHKGFCLVFRSINGCLYQHKGKIKCGFGRNTPNGIIAKHGSFGINEKFPFTDIEYCSECTMIDASMYMPQSVFGRNPQNEEERLAFSKECYRKSFEKHKCWEYEQEARLVLDTPTPWILGEHFNYTQDERLFYYQPTQLVGIICGAWMDENIKTRIKEIIHYHREEMWSNIKDDTVFDFVLFQAKISNENRSIKVVPELIYTSNEILQINNQKFTQCYQAWEEGEAIVFNGRGGAKKIRVS